MKSIPSAPKWSRVARLSLALAAVAGPVYALAQSTDSPRYTVVDLGPVGPSSSPGQPYAVSGNGLVSGETVLPNPNNPGEWVAHAVLWEQGNIKDISSPGLGGPNSAAFGVNIWGQAVGQADTQTPDPNGEDFCGSTALGLTHSGNTCVPFLWQNGTMAALPRLRNSAGTEGSNGTAFKNNDRGMVVGTAENGEVDSTCPGAPISPQKIEFKPVIWSKQFPWSEVLIQEFPTVDGDPDGVALAINDLGQVAGTSGPCGPFGFEPINLTPLHAVLWQNGKATDLGNLGGDGKFLGIFATSLNDYGQVVGGSDTTNDASFHGFLWQQGHITDLKPRAVDSLSVALAIGNNGLVFGASIDANFIPTAVLWRNGGTPTDMNTLVPADSTLNLQTACFINDKGEIIGFAALKSNPSETHAYLSKPVVNSGGGD